MKIRYALALVGPLMLALPASALADVNEELCATGNTHVCVTSKWVISGGDKIGVYLFNGSSGEGANWESVLTGFGFQGIAGGGTWSLLSVNYNNSGSNNALDIPGDWSFQTGGGLNSLSMTLQAGSAAGGSSGISTCAGPSGGGTKWITCDGNGSFGANDDWLYFVFQRTVGGLTEASLATLDWGFKVQAVEGIGGGSWECSTLASSNKFQNCTPGDDPPGGGQEVVPEPATMTLLATGLAGMAAARRRRKQQQR